MPSISEGLLVAFDQEMANTRKLLECLPNGGYDFQPHEKSMTLGVLAGHVAQIPMWAHDAIERESIDLNPLDGKSQMTHFVATGREETLARFDSLVEQARVLIGEAGDQVLMQPWSLLFKGRTVFSSPRREVLRVWFLNHLIHHRGQLSVYLRLLDIPIPGMYGPSADTKAQLRAQFE